ncbi:MAG: hypothetical protein ACOCQQ_03255 [Candidatus Nanoarchaeia archaeon]
MKHNIIKKDDIFKKQEFQKETDLTNLFNKNYKNIISKKSLFIQLEKQFKAKKFKNFKHSIGDGFLLVWDNPTTPSLYITEIELEKHDMNRHILPQIGDFISFIQSSTIEELNNVRNYLYQEIKKNKELFKRLQQESNKEVYELLDNAMEDLQILLVIDRMSPELSIGLSQIEKAINVKIRKIEVSLFLKEKEEVILYSDSEITEEDVKTSKEKIELEEYTLDYHTENKPEKIKEIIHEFLKHIRTKSIKVSPMKHYIGFFKNNNMIFSCVVRRNNVIFYSKAKINEFKVKEYNLTFRDVKNIGHYANHLPTEIILNELEQIDDLKKYFDKIYNKY